MRDAAGRLQRRVRRFGARETTGRFRAAARTTRTALQRHKHQSRFDADYCHGTRPRRLHHLRRTADGKRKHGRLHDPVRQGDAHRRLQRQTRHGARRHLLLDARRRVDHRRRQETPRLRAKRHLAQTENRGGVLVYLLRRRHDMDETRQGHRREGRRRSGHTRRHGRELRLLHPARRQDGHRPESGGRKRTAALGAAHPLRRGTGARTRSRALLCHLVEGRQAPVAHRRLGGQFLQRRLRRRKQGLCRRLRSDRRSVRRRILRTLSAERRRHVAVRGRQRDASDALRPERRQTRDLPRRRRGGGRKHLRRRFRNAGKLRPKGRLLA